MSEHSVILGGSNAARLLACPASYHEQLKSKVIDVESVYAAEGTMLHEAIAVAINRRLTPEKVRSGAARLPQVLTDEQREVLAKALEALETLKTEYLLRYGGKPFKVIALEKKLPLPGVTGAFGSVDLILANDMIVLIVDFKFGGGVLVRALYSLPDGSETINAQLAFYGTTAFFNYKRRFKGRRIALAIIQPRIDPPLDHVETDEGELDDFHKAFAAAVLEALGRDAHRERGEHCRFALCKSTCHLWTGAVFDLALIDPVKAALQASADQDPTAYGTFLSQALTMAELAEAWAVEIRKQAHVFLEDGGAVPLWKLVPKRGTRQWLHPDDTIAADLRSIGATDEDIYETSLRSVAQAEKQLKKKNIKLPGELHHVVSSGTTITYADDARPESSRGKVIQDLRQALKAL